MNKIKEFIRNISPFNNRTDMPMILYVIKVILIFWVFKFISELGLARPAGSYFAGAASGAVLLLVSVALTVLAGAIRYNGIFERINTAMVVLMLGGFVFQGAFEELLCRGVVQQLLQKRSVPAAVVVSAVLFALPHILNMDFSAPAITATAVLNLILISLVFSLLTIRFRSIWAACGMHSIWNYILYSILGLNLSGNDEITAAVFNMSTTRENILNGGAYGIEASIITTAVLGAAVMLLSYRYYDTYDRPGI